MKKIIFLAFLFISSIALANNQITSHWRSENNQDTIQINPGNNKVYLLITNDHNTIDGNPGCPIRVDGCQHNLLGLAPGDSALCEPKEVVQGVQIASTCTLEENHRTAASGTYQFLTKK